MLALNKNILNYVSSLHFLSSSSHKLKHISSTLQPAVTLIFSPVTSYLELSLPYPHPPLSKPKSLPNISFHTSIPQIHMFLSLCMPLQSMPSNTNQMTIHTILILFLFHIVFNQFHVRVLVQVTSIPSYL